MKSLRLDLDDLHVETFSPEPADAADRGTIFGYDSLNPDYCATGKYAGCDPGDTGGGGISGNSCDGPSCDYMVQTCAGAGTCPFSWITNCHRCQWDSQQTACVDC